MNARKLKKKLTCETFEFQRKKEKTLKLIEFVEQFMIDFFC